MIKKIAATYIKVIQDLLEQYNINTVAKFSPNPQLYFESFTEEFMYRSEDYKKQPYDSDFPTPLDIDGEKNQTRLLYTIGSPIRPTNQGRNIFNKMFSLSGESDPESSLMYEWRKVGDEIFYVGKEQTWNPDNKSAYIRPVSLLELPIDITIITQDIDRIYDIYLIIIQEIIKIQKIDVELDIENNGVLQEFCYWLSFGNLDDLAITHLENVSDQLLHSINLKCNLWGAYFSRYFDRQKTIKYVDLNLDVKGRIAELKPHRPVK